MTTPVRMSSEERREQLLDVTKEIVAEHGFHGVSIEAVARRAGITRPVIYGHFKDLQALLEALVDREGQRALSQLAEVMPTDLSAGDARELLLAGMRGYLEAVQADPVTWRLVLMPPEGAPIVLRERVEQGRAAVVATLAATVGPALGPDRASPDPELTARMMSALSDEGARLVLTDPENFPPERILRHTSWFLELLPVAR
ncbi:MAG TPA: TetR/AcrR family transcriptional regulator [Thermoleophilaceae bacterium]